MCFGAGFDTAAFSLGWQGLVIEVYYDGRYAVSMLAMFNI